MCLHAALLRETAERRRAECLAKMQADVVQLALDLLVREPDIEGFFGALTKTMVDEGDSHACAVWLIDDDRQRCDCWMTYVVDRLYTRTSGDWDALGVPAREHGAASLRVHAGLDVRRSSTPATMRGCPSRSAHSPRRQGVQAVGRSRRWCSAIARWAGSRCRSTHSSECWTEWWRVVLTEAIARQAALALHQSRLTEQRRLEERRKTILEERNRLARDIHDNLAQGFAAILMQLQAAQREAFMLPPAVAAKLETAVDLARTHMVEARRSVGTLRPNVGDGEDVARALKRIADLAQRDDRRADRASASTSCRASATASSARSSASRRKRSPTPSATRAPAASRCRRRRVRSIGFRLSVADDGRGIAREQSSSGFGMTSMQERAERIGASLTIVTAPRSGTEVVLAWEPSALPTQVHVAI